MKLKTGYKAPDPETFEEALRLVVGELYELMVTRHAKYGPANMLQAGIVGSIRRGSHDKLARLQRYYERLDIRRHCLDAGMPQEIVDRYLPVLDHFTDENLEDTHFDIASYFGIIPILLRRQASDGRRWWELPLAEERGGLGALGDR